MSEIRTRAEVVGELPNSVPEPSLTISQLQSLLKAAADLERAQRPVVIHEPQQPATAPQSVPAAQVPPTHVYVPMPPAAAFTRAPQPDKRSPWGLLFMVSGCTGLGACATTAITGSQYALLAFFACVALWGTSAYQLVILRKG